MAGVATIEEEHAIGRGRLQTREVRTQGFLDEETDTLDSLQDGLRRGGRQFGAEVQVVSGDRDRDEVRGAPC